MYTYQPCPECRKINRISLESLAGEHRKQPQCGACKSPIFMTGLIGEVNASGLMALVEKCSMPVVATFWAPHAKGSEAFASVYFQATQYAGNEVVFVRINALEHRLAPDAFGVRELPTTLFFARGLERARIARPLGFEEFMGWLQTVYLAEGQRSES